MFTVLTALLSTIVMGDDNTSSVHSVTGHWYTPDHNSMITVSDCGDGTPCGHVAWIAEQDRHNLDTNNRDRDLRTRPILGMELLDGFERTNRGWSNGSIYNPEDGKTYRAQIRRLDNGELEVKGCVGPICVGQRWIQADPDNLPADE